MSPSEVGWRAVDLGRQQVWARRQVRPGLAVPAGPAGARHFDAALPQERCRRFRARRPMT